MTERRGRWTLTVLLLVLLAHAAMPAPATALRYTLTPDSTLQPPGAPPTLIQPLTGNFDLAPHGLCTLPCEPDAYRIKNVVFSSGGNLLSSGMLEPVHAIPFLGPSFEELPDNSVMTGFTPIERSIIEAGPLTDDPQNHTDYEIFVERYFGVVLFGADNPMEIIYSDPRGTYPTEVTLVYGLLERRGTARFGFDGSGSVHLNEVEYSEHSSFGIMTFTAVPIPEPGTGTLVASGLLLVLAWLRRGEAGPGVRGSALD